MRDQHSGGSDGRGVARRVWAGIDVGGRRKGFHGALVDGRRLLERPRRLPEPGDVLDWLGTWHPRLVAVDSPRSLAPAGARLRECERWFVAARICGIRFTPSPEALARQKRRPNPTYYEWIEHGLELYAELGRAGFGAIECFPTAAWTRWYRPRGSEARGAWSRRALASLGLDGVPATLNQDERDAIGAAVMAREHDARRSAPVGEIVVPPARTIQTRQ